MSIELNLHWTNLNKKKDKDIKKLQKIEDRFKYSIDYYHNKMIVKFKHANEELIPQKNISIKKSKNISVINKLKSEIQTLIDEEQDYYLKVVKHVFLYENCKNDNSIPFNEKEEMLEEITKDYFNSLGIYKPCKQEKMDIYTCKICKNEMYEIDITIFSCIECGNTEQHIGDVSASYKENIEHEYVYDFSYKRITHFQEWLNNVQAKENTNIPEEIINKILLELKKERVNDLSSLKNSDIKKYLKRLKFNKYYEHSSIILNRINGVPPFTISQDIEKKLRIMFEKIQGPFEKYKPRDRKNFLSYAYVLRKFFELIDKREFLVYFPLLKSREKVFTHDYTWKQMCSDLGWNFIPSV
jgi:hypothetical protein